MVLSGGEPLLRKDIFELADYGTSLGLRMCMATNGALVNDEICEKMKQADIKMVSLSLDGSLPPSTTISASAPAPSTGWCGPRSLSRNGQKFLINSSFTKRNQPDIANTFKVAKSLGATAWYMFMIVPTGRGEEIMSELISKEDYEEILDWHYQQEKLEDDILMRPTCAPHYYRIVPQKAKAEGVKFERRSLTFSTGGGKGCIAAQTICLIDCFGNVKPCSYFHRTAGNVKDDPVPGNLGKFRDLQGSAQFQGVQGQVRRVRVHQRLRRLPRPGRCGVRGLHGGRTVLQLCPDSSTRITTATYGQISVAFEFLTDRDAARRSNTFRRLTVS